MPSLIRVFRRSSGAACQVFFGQDGFVQAEFLHQGALLGLADLHAQRLDLLGRCRRVGDFLNDFFDQILFDVAQVGIVQVAFFLGGGFGLAAALGGRLVGRGLGGAAGLFLGWFVGVDSVEFFGFGLAGLGRFGGRLGGGLGRGFVGHGDGGFLLGLRAAALAAGFWAALVLGAGVLAFFAGMGTSKNVRKDTG